MDVFRFQPGREGEYIERMKRMGCTTHVMEKSINLVEGKEHDDKEEQCVEVDLPVLPAHAARLAKVGKGCVVKVSLARTGTVPTELTQVKRDP